jgi:uncharacterized protein
VASEKLSARLRALRGPGCAGRSRPASGVARSAAAAAPRPRTRSAGARAVARPGEPHAAPLGVEVYLPGAELHTAHGAVYVHERGRSEMDKGTAAFLRRLAAALKRAAKLDVHEQLAQLLGEGLERALFLDLETTGLSSVPVFLTGVMFAGRTDWTLRQYFARNYSEEKALIRATLELLDARPNLVTFNGRSFDWPMVRTRAAYHKLRLPREPFHVDLLHHARRHWRGVFEDCRLQTLEWKVVGRRRTGDVPGAEIPERYHRFVKDGDPWPLAAVFHHNLLDLVTMADLLVEMLELETGS